MTAPPAAITATAHDGRAAPDPTDELTLPEATLAGFGGYSTLRRKIAEGELPARRVGREWRVRRGDLLALQPRRDYDDLCRMIRTLRVAPLSDEQIMSLTASFSAALRHGGGAA